MTTPLVSIVMPSYMKGRYIDRAVKSVLTQSGPEFELVIRDAGSTDETLQILQDVAPDPRVTVVVEPDAGQADAINRGFQAACGEILGWLNADDELITGALRQVASTFEDDAVELAYGRGYYIDENGQSLRPYDVRAYDRELLLTRDFILQPAAFWRRGLWDRVGTLDTDLNWAFDWEWLIRASRETRFTFIDADLARYRLTGDNKSLVGGGARQAELAAVSRRHGGRWQPTYVYWQLTRLGQCFPPARLLDPLLWRLFPGRIMA